MQVQRRADGEGNNACHVFILGRDYHLGDLLWFTAVLREYRLQRRPDRVAICCPDRPISRVLEGNPLIDRLVYVKDGCDPRRAAGGGDDVVHDLRPAAIGWSMVRAWRYRLPWLYYRDLWLQPRGQWLATYLHLGTLRDARPVLALRDEDFHAVETLPARYVAFAPHIGSYSVPLLGAAWQRLKGWQSDNWVALADDLRARGLEPITLCGPGQEPIPGTTPVVGLPIRQVAAIIAHAEALVSVESGLWFVAAAVETPFVIVKWWLPRSVDWAAPMHVPYRRFLADEAREDAVLASVVALMRDAA
jgi:hypothetical protein